MALRRDPTRTTTLRRRWVTDMRRRLRTVRRKVVQLVADEDAFGLAVNVHGQQWRFLTDAGKLDQFRRWFQLQVDREVLTTADNGEPWTQEYVNSAYRTGLVRAYTDARPQLDVEAAEFVEGSRAEFLRGAFAQPERVSKLRLLGTRAFEDLRGVTSAMAQQLNRELAAGIAEGKNPKAIAREMAKRIDGLTRKRAELIARTEVVYAHAEGQLDGFEDLGVDEVGIMAEWSTAGDDRVCPRCRPMEGVVLTVDEARGRIPLHPNCRCSWIPYVDDPPQDRRERLRKAVKASARRERARAR